MFAQSAEQSSAAIIIVVVSGIVVTVVSGAILAALRSGSAKVGQITATTDDLAKFVLPHFAPPPVGGDLDPSIPARVQRLEAGQIEAKDREARQQQLDHRLEALEAELREVRRELTQALEALAAGNPEIRPSLRRPGQ